VRSHAKASSAGSTLHRTGGRKKLGVLALCGALLAGLVLLSASASASKNVFTWIGSSGTLGGQFENPRGVAVNSTGAGGVPVGSIYVADAFNARIQQFSPSGDFVRAWGYNVIQSGKPGDLGTEVFEVCEVAGDCREGTNSVSPARGGELSSPQGIAVDQETGAVYVTDYGFLRVQKFSASGSFLAAFGKDVVEGGSTTTEICTVASECKSGEAGEAGGEFGSDSTGGFRPAVAPPGSPNAGDVYVTDPGNRRVQRFDSSGAFVEAFGADVEAPAGGNAFEVCTVAADCVGGGQGNGDGQFAFQSPGRIAVDDAGRIYAVDTENFRVQRFTPSPAFDTVYGATEISNSESNDIAIDPGATSAGDASDDRVFVVKPNFSPFEHRIKEFGTAADPSLIDTHMSDAGIQAVSGLAVDTASGRLFASTLAGGHRVYFLDNPLSSPAAVADPVTTKTDTTATLVGTVNPEGGNVTCKFQYSSDPGFSGATEVNVGDCDSLSISGGAQAVSANATGLIPNTTYHVRLQVSRPFVSASTVTSLSQTFTTDAVPPLLTNVGALQVEDTSARLVGTIDPRNADSSYVFEYGTTPALGSSTAPLAIGGGIEPIVVSQVITGLAKDTTYYYRLVATNDFGSTPSSQFILHTRAEPFPPGADRAYEQVSPVDKNFGNAVPGTPTVFPTTEYVALDGQAMAFGSQNAFGNPPAQVLKQMATYISRRDADGWHTEPVFPNTCAADATDTELLLFGLSIERAAAISANADRAVIPQREYPGCDTPALDPAAPLPATNLYRVDFNTDPIDYDLLVPGFDEQPDIQRIISLTGEYIAASDDFSHIFYGTSKGTSEGTSEKLDQGGRRFTKLWEWDNGTLRLASVDPNGDPFTSLLMWPTMDGPYGDVTQRWTDAVNTVSADGSRFFFQSPNPGNGNGPYDIYMRESGTATYKVSESECTASCDNAEPQQQRQRFHWASADGEVVTFASPKKLVDTDDSRQDDDLYAYRHSPNPTAEPNLTLISEDNEPADASVSIGTGDGREPPVLGVADDGSVVYFFARDQLVAGKPTAEGPKLYRWSWNGGAPTLQYLATASNDRQDGIYAETAHIERRVSRSGDTLMLETKTRIDAVVDHDEDIDVYLWRVGEGWSCTSCQTPGSASGGSSTTGRVGPIITQVSAVERPVARELMSAMAEEGETVFFQTQDALVPTDTNGPCAFDSDVGYYPCTDIYEWHDGKLSLLTTGSGSKDVGLLGTSESGEDVFFYSAERLVGWDKDNLIDVYDARVGGGLPEPPSQPAACEGESCRGASPAAPESSGAGTAVFQGPGNATDNVRKACPKGKRKVRRAGKTRCVKPRSTRKGKQRNRNRATNDNRRTAR
jgi:hypothetical protein